MTPPSSNTGGKSPPTPTLTPHIPRARTKIDWLAFAAPDKGSGPMELLRETFKGIGPFEIVDRKSGWNGYAQSYDLSAGGARVGLLAEGGSAQRGKRYVGVTGTGCALVSDIGVFADCIGQEGWPLRRVDIAADFVDGSVSHDTILEAHRTGGFCRGGRPPQLNGAGPMDGSHRGRTLYVGNRTSDMFCRNYEKGQKEVVSLAESTGYSFQDLLCSGSIGVEGEWVDPMKWYRCELELKSKKRPIPHEIVRRRDHYFAGAYPYFSQMLSNVEPEFILTPQQEGRLGLEAALAQIRRQYGRTLFTALMVEQGDIGAVWDRIVGSELNPTLVAAGALLK